MNMRDLGSPAHAERFFEATGEHFGSRLRFIVAALDERPVGGLVAIHFGQTALPIRRAADSPLLRALRFLPD